MSFSFHKSYFTRVCMASQWTPGYQLFWEGNGTVVLPWYWGNPACAKGQLLQWKCCQLLSSQLEIAGVFLIAVFPIISVFQAFLSQWIQCISKYYIITFQSGLCNKTVTAATKQLSSESSVLHRTVYLLKWKFFISKWLIHSSVGMGVFAAFILVLINAVEAGFWFGFFVVGGGVLGNKAGKH